MSVVQTLIGNIKGPQGSQGIQGETGAAGAAASVTVGSTTTTAYGNAASVTNSGTPSAAVLDFVIPQGKPGEATTKMGDLLLDAITSSAADFPSPQVGDTGKTAFGKITKFFSDVLAKFTQHEGDIATISTSPTTRSFNKGDYLVYEGTLYKVTANIANGGTLTVGTNITATSAGGELTSLNDSLTNMTHLVTNASKTGIAVNFPSAGVYLVIEGVQRNNVALTTSIDVFIVSCAANTVNYNKIYTGQNLTYNITTGDNYYMSWVDYAPATNLGVAYIKIA